MGHIHKLSDRGLRGKGFRLSGLMLQTDPTSPPTAAQIEASLKLTYLKGPST